AAADERADILLTPEGSVSGYTHRFDRAQAAEAVGHIAGLARQAGVGLALGTCFYEDDGLCRNELRFYDRDGQYLGCHTKQLRCGDLRDASIGEINHFHADPLRTFSFHGLTIGGLICNDLWANPSCTTLPDVHLTQRLAEMGARVIFHAVNGGRDASEWSQVVVKRYHECNLLMRAQAGGLWIVIADNSLPEHLPPSCYGGVVDPGGAWAARIDGPGTRYLSCAIAP
ncbi:MAG: carbon-nitrogen hydrolase family protein, partial [Clostridiales bacterium]|nr:carbon-nitrogen hydrolase family protein [Clostridiales bacterium]